MLQSMQKGQKISCFGTPTNQEEIQGVCILTLSGQSAIKATAIKTHN